MAKQFKIINADVDNFCIYHKEKNKIIKDDFKSKVSYNFSYIDSEN